MRDGHYNRERGAHALLIMAAAIFIVMIVAGIGLNAARYYLRKTELRSLTRVLALEGGNALPNPIAAVRAVHIFWRIQQRDLSNADMPVKFPTVTLTTFVHSGGGDRVKVLPDDKIGADLGGGTDSANLHYPNPTGARIELPVKYLTVRLEEKFPIFPLPFFPEDHAGVPITTVSIAAEAVAYMPPTDIVLVVESSGSLISPLASDSATNGGDSALAQFFSQPFSYAPNHSLSDSTATIPGLSDRYGSTCKDLAAGVSDAQCKMVVQRLLEQCYGESALNLKRAATLLYDLLAASGTYRVGVVHTVSTFSEQAPITVPLWTHPNLRRCEEDANTHINDTTINYGPPGLYDSVHKKFDCLNPTLKNLGGFGIDVDPNQGIGDPSATEYHPVTLEQPNPGFIHYPSSRCARFTNLAFPDDSAQQPFALPLHPFARISNQDQVTKAVTEEELMEGSYRASFFPAELVNPTMPELGGEIKMMIGGAQSDNIPAPLPSEAFLFRSTGKPMGGLLNQDVAFWPYAIASPDLAPIRLIPREMIWIKPSGYVNGIGMPHSEGTYQQAQFGMLRALHMLRNAPPRVDGLPVRRRIVLVLTDGIEDPRSFSNYQNYLDVLSPKITLQDGAATYVVRSEDLAAGLCEDVSSASGTPLPNYFQIDQYSNTSYTSSTAEILDGFKLGVLYYGFSGKSHFPNDPHQKLLQAHDYTTGALAATRAQCRTPWTMHRGRFFVEVAPDALDPELRAPYQYSASLAPKVARSIYHSELAW